MSKLETAFTKAMREQVSAGTKVEHGSGLNTFAETDEAGVNAAVQKATEARLHERLPSFLANVAVAKNQIKKMSNRRLLTDDELMAKRLIYPRMWDVKLLNIYRNLRTKLISLNGGRGNFITLVTSVATDCHSSLISANLAAAFAFDEGKTSLLIEGNIYAQSLTRLFDLKEDTTKGLMDYLERDDLSIKDVLHETGINRLRIIPGGKIRENSAEYFSSDKMKSFVRELLAKYPERYPIINAPAIQDSADARILLDLCDQVILVVSYAKSSEEEIKRAVRTIGKEKLAGLVLNQF